MCLFLLYFTYFLFLVEDLEPMLRLIFTKILHLIKNTLMRNNSV